MPKATYTRDDIERATKGKVNPGLLRSWREYLKPDGRDLGKSGAPNAYSYSRLLQAVLMAELRQHGVPLDRACAWANEWTKEIQRVAKNRTDVKSVPIYVAINAGADKATWISISESGRPFLKVADSLDETFTVVNLSALIDRVSKLIDHMGDDAGNTTGGKAD